MFLTDPRLRNMSRKPTEADVKRKFDTGILEIAVGIIDGWKWRFSLKNTPFIGKIIRLTNCFLKKASSSHLVEIRTLICPVIFVYFYWF